MRSAFVLFLLVFLGPVSRGAVQITYLGTNGYLLEAPGCTLLIDPYFTRLPLYRAGFDLTVQSDPQRVAWGLRQGGVPRHVDAILVTHGHIDHLLDVPPIARQTGARVIASRSSVELAHAMGTPLTQLQHVRWGESVQIGSSRVVVLAASHDRVLGRVPFPGDRPRHLPPRVASDWICGEPIAFLITVKGQRIYVDSGGTPDGPAPRIGAVDLAILGVAMPDARARLPEFLRRLRPRYFLASHQDNFFRPLEAGYSYGPLTDPRGVERVARSFARHSIVLPYFQPWTLR